MARAREAGRSQVFVGGVVQGVGFRPFVFNLATELGLRGGVHNRADGVVIEVEGDPLPLTSFVERLRSECPPLARIERLEVTSVLPRGDDTFEIQDSEAGAKSAHRFFSPDVATCEACLAELFDPSDRRHRHPFINCTRCGPRLTITCDAPYDRASTTMASFSMCAACRAEYDDPSDRRFHAQPIACPACGPRLLARDADGRPLDGDPLELAEALLRSNRILALKGLGGFHLACDATSEAAVAKLRRAKHREEKPFAVMVADLESARKICHVSKTEAELLGSFRGPIVLLRRRADTAIATSVAPDSPFLGLMLAYTPLHHLLARGAGASSGSRPLVMTSGNRADEPIVFDDREASRQLRGLADGFLGHDRPIHHRCDDSITRVVAGTPLVLRRSRGYAPEPLRLPIRCSRRILALGGHMKNTFALGRGDHAFTSHHLGDLGDFAAYRSFRDAVAHYERLFAFEPEVLVHDLHPDYATTHYALERQASSPDLKRVAVQHHHAHLASCMAENGLVRPVIGVTFDGTGYGTDGTFWGGEFLVGDFRSFRRAAFLSAVPMPGGEHAIREPWRMAVAHLRACDEEPGRFLPDVPRDTLRFVQRMLDKGLSSPVTTSAGRLFDAIGALLGLRTTVSYEGQTAIALENLSLGSDANEPYPFDITARVNDVGESADVIDTRPLVKAVLGAIRRGEPNALIASQFHATLVEIIAFVATRLRDTSSINDVVLTGGVFQNARLLEATKQRLETSGFDVFTHARVPPNDGGLALGQLAVAAASLEGAA